MKYIVKANQIPCEFEVEADSPEEAVEQAKEIWKEQVDDIPWSVEEKA